MLLKLCFVSLRIFKQMENTHFVKITGMLLVPFHAPFPWSVADYQTHTDKLVKLMRHCCNFYEMCVRV